jgi:hypothetical protein
MKFLIKRKIIKIVFVAVFVFFAVLSPFNTETASATVLTFSAKEWSEAFRARANSDFLVLKERVLDRSLGYTIAKTAINVVTESIVNWINRGFDGNPAFVDDFGGFLREVADRETAHFIEGISLELLCSPWRSNIRVALSVPTGFREEVACTLSDIVANMDDFVKGDFSQGGWGGWFQLTTRPNNNPYSLYISSASELDSRIARQQGIDTAQLNWGDGFFSKQECEELPAGVSGPTRCKTVTPGSVIEDQLTHVLGSGVRQLELADEFDEIVGALMQQLVSKTFTGSRGLRGLSEGAGGQTSFTSQLGGSTGGVSLLKTKEAALLNINRDINDETDYKNVKQATLNSVLASEVLLLNVASCYAGKLGGSLTGVNESTAQARISTAVSTVSTQITPTKTSLENDIEASSQIVDTLNTFKTDILNANTVEKVGVLSNSLASLRLSGELNTSDVFNAQDQQSTVTAQMSALNATTNTQITECQVFPPTVVSGSSS